MQLERLVLRTATVVFCVVLAAGCSLPDRARETAEQPAARPAITTARATTPEPAPAPKPTAGESGFPTPEPISLDALLEAGRLRIEAGAHDRTTVVVRPSDPSRAHDVETAENTVVSFASGTLTIRTPRRLASWEEPGSIDVRVVLPERSNVEARVSVADVDATGVLNRAELESSTGDLAVDRASEVVAGTAAGHVRLGDITRSADLESAAGDISLDKAGGAVLVRTASGSVRIGAVWQGQVFVQGTASDVRIGVPAGVAAWQDLDSLGGKVRSTVETAEEAGAALKIQVHTTGGDIDVVRS